jgi:hypothetical protein
MPMLLGFILGILLTIAGAYAYDSNTGRAANGLSATAAGGQAPMVNWDIVSGDWQNLQADVRSRAKDLEQSFKRHTG